jgi:DDE superfamily endonuclease
LDVGVNKPFKAQYRKEFHKWRKMQTKSDATKGKNMKNPTRQDVLNFTSAAWESITEECIKNAFLKSEITFVESIFEVEEEMADL